MRKIILSLFIFLSTVLAVMADVVVVAYMGESQVVLVESANTFKTGNKPDGIGWANL